MNTSLALLVTLMFVFVLQAVGCTPKPPDELDAWGTVEMTMGNQKFHLWTADDPGKQEQGLMHVTAERMAPMSDGTKRGMIFIFDHERILSFWMKNTIIPLDIAYLDSNGVVVSIYTMTPLDTRHNQYVSARPARYAIEVNAGVYQTLGIAEGNQLEIPDLLLNR